MPKTPLMLGLTGLSGALLASAAYPDNAVWLAIFPATALMLFALTRSRFRHSWIIGFITGFTFYAAQIPWMTVYLGPVPWLALSVLEGVIFACGAAAINSSYRFSRKHLSKNPILISIALASLWTAREWVASNFPYGGFPWSRLALSQSNSPLANWVFWGGNSLLSFVIVFTVALVMLTWSTKLRPQHWGNSPVAALVSMIFVIPLITPTLPEAKNTSIEVAAVQGNANAGLFANPIPGSILKNHLDASEPLLTQKNKPDVVIWPENAADQNPLGYRAAKSKVSEFVSALDVPLIFGTITSRGDDIFNSSILWLPGVGSVDWYDKKRPVAFGEYVPDRAFFRMLAPELIDLIPRGYSFGTRDGIFQVPVENDVKVDLGAMICFEVAVDDITRELVRQGAQVLVVQTNNADFGTTNESAQQLAIAKLRAIESGRAVVNISTVGLSAIVLPTGEIIDSLPSYQAGIMQKTLPLRSSITPAMSFGDSLEIVNNFSALGQLLIILWVYLNRRKAND